MATVGTTSYVGNSPKIRFRVNLKSKTRTSNSQMSYTFTVYGQLQYAESWLGTGYPIRIRIKVGSGSYSRWTTLKANNTTWNGDSLQGGINITVTAPSTSEGQSQSVQLEVTDTYKYSGKVGTVSSSGLLYTSCTAPTSIIISGNNIAVPNGKITVKWSGAKSGTKNSISGYRIFYKYNAVPTLSSYTGYKDVSASTISTTIPVSSTRGDLVYIKIQTKGSAGTTYWSPISSTRTYGYTNSLPNAPNVIISKTKVPSSGGSITFTVTPGADNNSQKCTLYYTTSLNSTKVKFNSPLIQTITNDVTYYFYTYDGLEYSTVKSINITKNKKPIISNFLVEGNDFIYNEEEFKNIFSLKADISSTTTSGIFYFYLHNLTTGKTTLIGNGKNNFDNINAITVGNLRPGDDFYFSVKMDDSIEFTDEVFSDLYKIPETYNKITRTYNQLNSFNIQDTNGDFDKKIRVYLPYDSYLDNSKTISCIYNINNIENSTTNITYFNGNNTSYNNSITYCDIILPNELVSGNYQFKISINCKGILREYTFNKSKTKTFLGGELNGLNSIIKPFTNKISASPSILSPIDFINSDKLYDLENYNIKDYSSIKFYLTYNGSNSKSINCFEPNSIISNDDFKILLPDTDNTIRFQIGENVWYNLLKDLDILNILYNTDVIATISITNLFGETSYYTTKVTFNFQEPSNILDFKVKLNDILLDDNSTLIREGQKFNWTLDIESYNPQNYYIQIYINRSINSMAPSQDDTSWYLYTSTQLNTFNINRQDDRKLKILANLELLISELYESNYIFFKAVVIDAYNNTYTSKILSAGRSNRHVAPFILINGYNFKRDENIANKGTIQIDYSILDNGGGCIDDLRTNLLTNLINSLTIEKSRADEDGKIINIYPTIFNPEQNSGSIIINIEDFIQTAIHLYINIKTKLILDKDIDDSILVLKELRTADIIIYNINPTLAIRKQYLGINSTNFSNKNRQNTVLVIGTGEKGKRDTIYLDDADGIGPSININTRKIESFIIDGGEW